MFNRMKTKVAELQGKMAEQNVDVTLVMDPDYERTHPDYSSYTKRFENKSVVTEAVESVNKRKRKKR